MIALRINSWIGIFWIGCIYIPISLTTFVFQTHCTSFVFTHCLYMRISQINKGMFIKFFILFSLEHGCLHLLKSFDNHLPSDFSSCCYRYYNANVEHQLHIFYFLPRNHELTNNSLGGQKNKCWKVSITK
jgi:hypothetical protein